MSALFQNVLTASFHGSIVIAAVLLLRLILRKAPRKYICYLWLLAGLRLLMPFQIQSDLSLQPEAPPESLFRWEAPAPVRVSQENLPVFEEGSPDPAAPAESAPAAAPAVPTAPETGLRFSGLLPWLWLGVATLFAGYSIISYVNLKKKVRDAVKIPGGWESEHIDTAFILGFVKPRIYIPVGMTPRVRRHILAHERTHLDKGDHWIKMIGFLALSLHWFNPLVWAAYILLCKDIETACDERVVQFMGLNERKEYASALLSCSTNRVHYAASPVAFGEVSVKSRILSILNYRKPSFWVGLLSIAAISFVMVCLVTSPTDSPETPAVLSAEEFTAPIQPPMEENPDWGLSLIAQAHSPTTMTLYYGVGVEGVPWDGTAIYKDRPYWLEAWNGDAWEEVPLIVADSHYEGSSGIELSKENANGHYLTDELDWSLTHGPLPEGDYRIRILPTRNGEARPHYAWFHIYGGARAGAEAEAVSRCESALDKLRLQSSYSCTVLESNEYGNLLPVAEYIRNDGSGRVNSYYGDICYNVYYCTSGDALLEIWDDPFYPQGNSHISFPEGNGSISSQKVQFLCSWVDKEGSQLQATYTYTFDTTGALSMADCLTQSRSADGELTQSRRCLVVESASYGDTYNQSQTPKDSFTAAAESPWGIHFRVDDDLLKPTAGDIWLSAGSTIGVSTYTTDSSYWLEKKEEDTWKKLPSQAGDPSWGSGTYTLSSRTISIDQVDWTPYYGTLEPGLYRMGKRFYSGQESIIQYAEFLIHPTGGIRGSGGAEAIARIDAALERLRSGNYCIEEKRVSAYGSPLRIGQIHWKYNGSCVTDYYDYYRGDGYQHSVLQEADGEYAYLFYDMWMHYFNWHDQYTQVLFPQGASYIGGDRISFATAFTDNNGAGYLSHYDIYFDSAGDITRIEYTLASPYDAFRSPLILEVVKKSDGEIRDWVEPIRAQQQGS